MNKPKLYHGHTIIELRNPLNGKRERIEHDNDFTDNIGLFLSNGGFFNNSPWAHADWRNEPIYHRLIGGILLFDKAIEPVNGQYPLFAPAGTKMIANGSVWTTNNGNTTEFGSYNAAESSFTSNALTYVYDWTTSQGNGEIASVCLTSEIGGYIGYGNSTSNIAMATTRTLNYNQSTNALSTDGSYCYNVIDNVIYRVIKNPIDELELRTMKTPIAGVDLFTSETVETVALPSTFVGNTGNFALPVHGVGFAVFKFTTSSSNCTLSADSTAPVAIYNIKTKTWTTRSIKAPSSHSIYFEKTSSRPSAGYVVGDWVTNINQGSSSNTMCRVKLDTYEYEDYSTGNIATMALSDDLFMHTSTGSNNYIMVDNVNDTAYMTNGAGGYFGGSVCDGISVYALNSSSAGGRYRNPLYLATVNNLDNEVTKTSQFNMKVTYIVTREE